MIPYGRQDISESDIAAVVEVLRSDWLTQGPVVESFEETVRRHCWAGHAVAVNSATSALHLACRAIGLGPGDTLWTSPNTFVASANAALYCGADVDFVDIDSRTYNLSVPALAEKLERASRSGTLPKVVMPVHFAGQSCDLEGIAQLAHRYGFSVLEDASHAIGGEYKGAPIGDCRFSSMAVFSFHPVKIVTTGEGGMAVTNDSRLADRMRELRSHGITRDPGRMESRAHGPWYYEQTDLGYNYRLTDMQAALGKSQMGRIGEFVDARHRIARRYGELLADLPLILPWQDPDGRSAYHLYPVCIDPARTKASRLEVFGKLRASGIGVNVHYIPVHTQPYYRRLGFRPGDFPAAEGYYGRAMSLPMFPGLTEQAQLDVVACLHEAFGR
ncbi:MAG TPA: UDP-4-amino-4,6-dideoxy-N-acetyl-beta-L-altrosamine transaminase [Burkholderiales bacterium]|nr:UDP-4-amino-4,6-dideoxy-N-acetyl-beta-L-altrosamine transaminase [Burkholderiales bacterium]